MGMLGDWEVRVKVIDGRTSVVKTVIKSFTSEQARHAWLTKWADEIVEVVEWMNPRGDER